AAGYWRVRVAAMARALEGQCIVVQAVTVGTAAWCPAVDENTGCPGFFGPPDTGFPSNGILALGAADKPGWTFAEIDLSTVANVRKNGQVLNKTHWDEQATSDQNPSLQRLWP
ncbi:MAG: amidohydrolase, partial [Pseudomonadota bacterium]